MENILIIGHVPYGYNTDWYKFSENLSKSFDVYYLCQKGINKEYLSEHVKVIYFEATSKNYYYKTFLEAKKLRDKIRFKKVFVYVYPSCSLLRLLFSKEQLILDIRTSYIKSPILTWICNKLIKIESTVYGKISVISLGVGEFLHLKKNKCYVLPLGGEALEYYSKSLDTLNLLYLGTLYDRNIHKTVEGFALFKKLQPEANVKYTIVGVGSQSDIDLIQGTIEKYDLQNDVHYIGEKRGDELIDIFKQHNVGVSYIPLTKYYDCQPPTKTFEYLLATMLVLATPTTENKKVINEQNGCLSYDDTPESFASSISILYLNRHKFDLKGIYEHSIKYSWGNIVDNYLLPLI